MNAKKKPSDATRVFEKQRAFRRLAKTLDGLMHYAESFDDAKHEIHNRWWESIKNDLRDAENAAIGTCTTTDALQRDVQYSESRKCQFNEDLWNRIHTAMRVAFNLARLLLEKAQAANEDIASMKQIAIEADMRKLAKWNLEFHELSRDGDTANMKKLEAAVEAHDDSAYLPASQIMLGKLPRPWPHPFILPCGRFVHFNFSQSIDL
ncbi:MAG: hypothetical protein ACKVUS_10640 [Saprospiraceae bacterium]